MAYIFLIIAFSLNALASVFLKIHATRGMVLKPLVSPLLIINNIYFFGALLLFGSNIIFYSLALSRLSLSTAYPIMTIMTFIIVSLFSIFYFNEHISLPQIIGYACMLVGIALVITFNG